MNPYTKKFKINKTFTFLYPILRLYGKECEEWLKKMPKCGVFIDDLNNPKNNEDCLFIVADVPISMYNLSTHEFENEIEQYISFFSKKKYVREIYILSINKFKAPDKIIFVFELPEMYKGTINKFLEGDYLMFSKEDIKYCWRANNANNKAVFEETSNILLGIKQDTKPIVENEVLFL